jgi:hypothetical protein
MPRGIRLVVVLFLVAAVAWLGFRAVRAFDTDRHTAEAAAVEAAPDTVTYDLAPVPTNGQGAPCPPDPGAPEGQGAPQPQPHDSGAPEREGNPAVEGAPGAVHSPTGTGATTTGADGQFSYRPGVWLSVVDLEGLEPLVGDERYLVFLRNWAGWTLAGAARPGPDGEAQVRSAAEPRPRTVYEVVVTRAVDDATSIPHGQPVLQWFDGSLGPPRARPFDFARGL